MTYQIIPARASHIRTIAARMRKADRDEVAASSGKSPLHALSFSFRKSHYRWTVLIDGQPEIMFGVGDVNVLGGIGAPWLLATDAVERVSRDFLRQSRHLVRQLSARYDLLINEVDLRNTVSIRWLEWLGFQFYEPHERNGHKFMRFEMRSKDV